jgi:hypothetical protein
MRGYKVLKNQELHENLAQRAQFINESKTSKLGNITSISKEFNHLKNLVIRSVIRSLWWMFLDTYAMGATTPYFPVSAAIRIWRVLFSFFHSIFNFVFSTVVTGCSVLQIINFRRHTFYLELCLNEFVPELNFKVPVACYSTSALHIFSPRDYRASRWARVARMKIGRCHWR